MLNPVTPEFEAKLRALLPGAAFKDPLAGYFTEPRARWAGQGIVVAPGSTEEVAAVVRACHDAQIGVVPYGGGTGLVGGQILPDGPTPVVLSLIGKPAMGGVSPVKVSSASSTNGMFRLSAGVPPQSVESNT